MKKIVILSDNPGRSLSRMTLLKALFPECEIEIQVVSPDDEDLKSHPSDSYRSSPSLKNQTGGADAMDRIRLSSRRA